MHFVIGTLIAVATLIFWIGRASQGARHIADAANEISNIPRKRRFRKKYNKQGYDLVETPIEAATVLMISTAKLGEDRRVTGNAELAIIANLRNDMQLQADDADGLFRQMNSLTHDIVLPESALFPMVDLLRPSLNKDEAVNLADMLSRVGETDGGPNAQQKEFIRRYKEYMGLLN